MSVDRPRLARALALILAALIASASTVVTAPAHGGVPIPRPRPPAVHPLPHEPPQIQPRPGVRDILPEVYPSNDPNAYDLTGSGAIAEGASRGASQSASDDDSGDGGTGSGALPAGPSRGASQSANDAISGGGTVPAGPDDDNNEGGLNLGSIGLAGGVAVSVASLLMWLRRKR